MQLKIMGSFNKKMLPKLNLVDFSLSFTFESIKKLKRRIYVIYQAIDLGVRLVT